MRAILLNSSMYRVIIVLEDVRLLVFVGNILASNSSRYIALSFKLYSSLHLYCYCEKKNIKCASTFVFVRPEVPSERCEINRNIDLASTSLDSVTLGHFDTVFETIPYIEVKFLFKS